MRKIPELVMAGTALALLSGCSVGSLFNRVRPDEFAVQRQAPLFVPPDYALTPPQPGAPRPASRTTEQETLQAMFGGPAPRSPVESAVNKKAGGAEPAIRSTAADPKTNTADKSDITRDIVSAPQGDGRDATVRTGTSN